MNQQALKALDRRFLARGEPAMELELSRSDGSYLFDARGRKYVDFVSGWSVGNLGWNNPAIKSKVRHSTAPDYVAPDFLYRRWAELARLLADIAPGQLTRSYRATGGTEAVDIALQVAMASTGRHKFISLEGSYHGNSIGTRSVASSEYAKTHRTLVSYQVPEPLDSRAADRIETLLKRHDIAGFIMEPVVIILGVLVPDRGFMQRVAGLCRKYGTLFIADEVGTGFGRTGALFASEHFGLEPDIMCLGKAITAGYAGMGATMVTPKVARSLDDEGTHFWSTYGWHPLATEAAIANLQYFRRRKTMLMRNVDAMSGDFRARLARIDFKYPARIRVKGLAIAVDVGKPDYAERLQKQCLEAGVVFTVDEALLMLFPCLTIDRETAREGLDVLENVVAAID